MIDVVMTAWSPTKRRMEYFQKSFKSFKKHTHIPHRLIVVDNGPEPQTQWLYEQEIDTHLVPVQNQGVGRSRNLGAQTGDAEFIAFVDNDIGYFTGWLARCVTTLKKYQGRHLIATPVLSKPMLEKKHVYGDLGHHKLYRWASCMAMVLTRDAYTELGGFSEKTNVGHRWNRAMRVKGYFWIHHPDWHGRHLDNQSTYHYKRQQFKDGRWITRPGCRWGGDSLTLA